MGLPSGCFAALLLASLLWNSAAGITYNNSYRLRVYYCYYCIYINTGQSVTAVKNPVDEGEDFMFNCTKPTVSGTLDYSVNGNVPDSQTMSRVMLDQEPTYTLHTFFNVTIQDRGTVFSCFILTTGAPIPLGSVTLMVNCELIV